MEISCILAMNVRGKEGSKKGEKQLTLTSLIENSIRSEFPQIKRVEAI